MEGEKKYEEDNSLKAKILGPELCIKNFIDNEPLCNYELYLLEFVNSSDFFSKKSDGEKYSRPVSESNGECDCISRKYKMDFKLVAGESRLQARSILTNQKRLLAKGVIVTYAPKNPDDQIKCTRLNVVLREKKIEELLEISKKQSKENKEDKEIHRFLKVLETKKNLFLFLPFIFSFKKNYKFEEGSDRIGELFSKEYRGCIKYRNMKTKKLDTYVSFIYGSYIVVLQLVGENLQIVDRIKLSKSLIYQKLSEYSL